MANKFVRKYNYEKIKNICNKINFSLLETKESFDLKYKNTMSKIRVMCNNCQKESEIQINNLINKARYNKYPCLCYYKHTREDFLRKAKEIHGNKYDYSLITEEWWDENYKHGNKTQLPIICPNHGIFYQTYHEHVIIKNNCIWCTSKLHYRDFLKKAKEIHKNKYEYLFDEQWWIENFTSQENTKILIKCPKHGEFWQVVANHLRQESGCPKCRESKGERKIRKYLEENNINYKYQYPIKIKNRKKSLYFDFYLPEQNIAIEFDGVFHYEDHPKQPLEITKKRDELKNQYCKENKIKLIRIPYWEYDNIEKILEKEIKEH